jgi:putative PIN family toxin of toxin-antitoxin system
MPLKFVLDINIYITYIINDKFLELSDLKDYDIELCGSNPMLKEFDSVISRKKLNKYLKYPISFYIDWFLDTTSFYDTTPVFTACKDPKDNYIFDLAYQSNADYVVTGDKEVLNTPVFPLIKIISLSEFKTLIKEICK